MIGEALAKSATAAAAPWLEIFKPFWPLIWRAALVALIFWGGWHYGSAGAEKDLADFKAAQATATAAAVAQLKLDVAARDSELITQERDSETKIRDLIAEQRDRPPRVVRVCPTTVDRQLPGVPAAAGLDAAHEGGGGELQSGTGRDIGPGLTRLTDRADIVRVKCLAQQDRTDQLAAIKVGPSP